MRLFGLTIQRTKAATGQVEQGGWRRVLEPFTGAWQRNKSEDRSSLLSYPTLYACLSRVSGDIGKLPYMLKRRSDTGVLVDVDSAAYSPVLRHPNDYQTPQQFREAWILSVLTHGNTYVLKQRDNRGVVTALYILDPTQVMPAVAPSGEVFYKLNFTSAANLLPDAYGNGDVTIPAREIIHDRLNCFHHQLIGVPPIAAANWPAVKNLKILRSASDFFSNHSQPGGILSGPAGMSEKDADALRTYWNENYSGKNAGKVAVIGADVKFTPFSMKSADSQMVEQMEYSDRQICQPFSIPPFIIGIGNLPAGLKADDMASIYYRFALQARIDAMETLLNKGLGIKAPMSVQLDVNQLLRMDMEKRGTVFGGLIKDGIATPNEARQEFNLPPLEGGNTVYMQQQDIPLSVAAQQSHPDNTPPAEPDVTDEAIKQFDEAMAA